MRLRVVNFVHNVQLVDYNCDLFEVVKLRGILNGHKHLIRYDNWRWDDIEFDRFCFIIESKAMKLHAAILLLFWRENVAGHEDLSKIGLIEKYVLNEKSPTILSFRDVCWTTNTKIKIIKQLSYAGIRSTFSTNENTKYVTHNTLFLADMDCPRSNEVLSNASSSNHFKFPYRWLLLSSTKGKSDSLQELALLSSSDLVLATRENTTFVLDEWHKIYVDGPLISARRGLYNGEIMDSRQARELYRRRKNLMGHPLTMANVIQDSNSTRYHLEDRLEGEHDAIAKLSWMVVNLAFQMLNATPQAIFSHRWGYKHGRWSGMIDDILNDRADLGSNCAVYPERAEVITYTDIIAPFKVGFIFRQPPLPYVANIFTMPFSTEVWLAVAACVTFSTIALYLASKWEIGLRTQSQLNGTMSDAVLVTISAFSQQGCTLEPKRASGRIALFVVFAALMALYAAYAANIVVLLQAPSTAVRTLKQLSQSKLTLAANDVDYNRFVFGMYTDPLRMEITRRVKPPKGKQHFYPINEGVERIRQGLFAFHSIVEPIYRRVELTFHAMEKCDLVEVDFMMGFDPYVPVKKDSPYLELLRVSFKKIRESGLQSALNKRHQVPKPTCSQKVSAFSSVGLLDLRPVVALMLYGIAISIIILIIEIITFKIDSLRDKSSVAQIVTK